MKKQTWLYVVFMSEVEPLLFNENLCVIFHEQSAYMLCPFTE